MFLFFTGTQCSAHKAYLFVWLKSFEWLCFKPFGTRKHRHRVRQTNRLNKVYHIKVSEWALATVVPLLCQFKWNLSLWSRYKRFQKEAVQLLHSKLWLLVWKFRCSHMHFPSFKTNRSQCDWGCANIFQLHNVRAVEQSIEKNARNWMDKGERQSKKTFVLIFWFSLTLLRFCCFRFICWAAPVQ